MARATNIQMFKPDCQSFLSTNKCLSKCWFSCAKPVTTITQDTVGSLNQIRAAVSPSHKLDLLSQSELTGCCHSNMKPNAIYETRAYYKH